MTKILDGLYYTRKDEWARVEGNTAVIGISDYAQDSLSDIVYLEILPGVGETIAAGEQFATVESVKAAAEIYAPLSGEVVAVNSALADTPEAINSDPYGAWMIRVHLSDTNELKRLLDANAYRKYCDERA
ncbi:MAG: glycine cleavage system protein GcvH [Chloroflexota bacterium]